MIDAGLSATDALERFERDSRTETMALAVLGRDGSVRVWLADEISSRADFEWAARGLLRAATVVESMQPEAGTA